MARLLDARSFAITPFLRLRFPEFSILRIGVIEILGDQSERDLSERIKELNEKGTQLLLFLSFALVAGVTLKAAAKDALTLRQAHALTCAVRLWVVAFFPILISVLPIKELFGSFGLSLERVRTVKIYLLTSAIVLICVGSGYFLKAL